MIVNEDKLHKVNYLSQRRKALQRALSVMVAKGDYCITQQLAIRKEGSRFRDEYIDLGVSDECWVTELIPRMLKEVEAQLKVLGFVTRKKRAK